MQNVDYSNFFGFGCGTGEETYLAKFIQNSFGVDTVVSFPQFLSGTLSVTFLLSESRQG